MHLIQHSRRTLCTFSMVARDPLNGDLGVIVQSKFPAVGALVPHAQAEIGAVATQAWANVSFGPRALELLRTGKSASDVLTEILRDDDKREHRQVGIVDSHGRAAAHTGRECMDWAGHIVGDGYSCQGNILAGEAVVLSMVETFEKTEGDLIDRLFAGLRAAQREGGDRRGMQSAAILVVRKNGGYEGTTDRYVDVRVDDHPNPIEELERIFKIYDMTLLNREPPSRLIPIEGVVAIRIQEALVRLGYLDRVDRLNFSDEARRALQSYLNYSNFENKARDDNRIWQSVYEYLLQDTSITPRSKSPK